MADNFPRPYVNTVPKENAEPMMEYVNFNHLGIGARPSGMPKEGPNNIRSLDHVGSDASGNGSKRKWGGK